VGVGKLYVSNHEDSAVRVSYRLHDETSAHWHGELILLECRRINDSAGYIIELEDKRRGDCYLKNEVDQSLSKVAPCYRYNFTGISSLN